MWEVGVGKAEKSNGGTVRTTVIEQQENKISSLSNFLPLNCSDCWIKLKIHL